MKVLIIDDEPLVRRSLERLFLSREHQVEVAENGIEGLKRWKEFQPDLIFLDVLMPGLSGPEVLKNYREDSGKSNQTATLAKVILMSAFTGDKQMIDPQGLGADLFLAKPFESVFEVYDQAMELMK